MLKVYKYYSVLEKWKDENFLEIDIKNYETSLEKFNDKSVLEAMKYIYLTESGLMDRYNRIINKVKYAGRNWRDIDFAIKNTIYNEPNRLDWLLSLLEKEHSVSGKVNTAVAFGYRVFHNHERSDSVLSEFESWINWL